MMLRRKRWRALRRRPGQSLALALVLGLGVAAFTLKVLAVTVIGLVPGAPLDWWAAGGAMRDFPDFIPAGIGLYPAVVAVVVVAATLTMLRNVSIRGCRCVGQVSGCGRLIQVSVGGRGTWGGRRNRWGWRA